MYNISGRKRTKSLIENDVDVCNDEVGIEQRLLDEFRDEQMDDLENVDDAHQDNIEQNLLTELRNEFQVKIKQGPKGSCHFVSSKRLHNGFTSRYLTYLFT